MQEKRRKYHIPPFGRVSFADIIRNSSKGVTRSIPIGVGLAVADIHQLSVILADQFTQLRITK